MSGSRRAASNPRPPSEETGATAGLFRFLRLVADLEGDVVEADGTLGLAPGVMPRSLTSQILVLDPSQEKGNPARPSVETDLQQDIL